MITVKSAIKKIQSNIKSTSNELIHIKESSDRVLSDNCNSFFSNPPFNVSSMDGYACRKKDIKKLPKKLNLIGISSAGKNFMGKIKKDETVRILTGAKVPEGSDTVIIQENTSNKTRKQIIVNKLNNSTFIRKKGMDFKANDNWTKTGFPIKIKDIALGCAMNIQKVMVKKKPNIAILSTGDELV
ncbi:MAG: Molybdopterin molybdenumtransferase, partial [Alphaproteobacteria bacterium MarineAlpha2_Bin1]